MIPYPVLKMRSFENLIALSVSEPKPGEDFIHLVELEIIRRVFLMRERNNMRFSTSQYYEHAVYVLDKYGVPTYNLYHLHPEFGS